MLGRCPCHGIGRRTEALRALVISGEELAGRTCLSRAQARLARPTAGGAVSSPSGGRSWPRRAATQPPVAVSAMDGYAVRAADVGEVPAELRWSARSRPAAAYRRALAPGEAVRIFTGAPLPAGADAIVIQEDTERRRRPGRG